MLLSACCILVGGSIHITESAHFINILVRYTDFIIARRKLDSADGIAACQSVRACTRECPRGIDVGEEIWQLIAQIKER